MEGIQHREFIALSNVKDSADEKLAHLLSIRETRLNEHYDLPNRVEAACSKISDTLMDFNLAELGYHCHTNIHIYIKLYLDTLAPTTKC